MIRLMRDLTDDDKMSFRSLPEVVEFLNELAGKLRSEKAIRFRRKGKKAKAPPRHAIATAIFLRVMAMSAEEQRAFVARGMDDLNRLLGGPDISVGTVQSENLIDAKKDAADSEFQALKRGAAPKGRRSGPA